MQFDFKSLLDPFTVEELDPQGNTIYATDPSFRLIYTNRGWHSFAAENSGDRLIGQVWPPGRSILESVPKVLLPYYSRAFAHVLDSGEPWEHLYECSSPSFFRNFKCWCCR